MMLDYLKYYKRCVDLTDEGKYIQVENDGSYYTERIGPVLCIYFEKSNGLLDWKHNFMFPAKPYRDMENKWYCHRGFLKVWKSIEPYLRDEIMDPEIKGMIIIGYSHGAAIAQLCHEYATFNRPDIPVCGVGFGSPRLFWGFAKKAVRERFSAFLVIRNGRDLVTYLPPVFFGFRHICPIWELGEHFSWKDFIHSVEEKGLAQAVKDGDLLGMIKDHYPENYIKALEDIEGVEDEGASDEEEDLGEDDCEEQGEDLEEDNS